MEINIVDLPIPCKFQVLSPFHINHIADLNKPLFIRLMYELSETWYNRLEDTDSLSETRCQRSDDIVRFSILITCYSQYASHLGVQPVLCVQTDSGCIVCSFPFLNYSKAFSECRLATNRSHAPHCLLQQASTGFCGPGWNTITQPLWDCWWCHTDCSLACMQVAGWFWEMLCGYDGHLVNMDWSGTLAEDCLGDIPISTRCAQTQNRNDDYSNSIWNRDQNIQLNLCETAALLQMGRIWTHKILVSGNRSNRSE